MARYSKDWLAAQGQDPLSWGELNPEIRGEISKRDSDRISTWTYIKQVLIKEVNPSILGAIGATKVGYITKVIKEASVDTDMRYQTYESPAHRETVYITVPTEQQNPDGTTKQEMIAKQKPIVLKSNKIPIEAAGLVIVRLPEFDSQKPIPAGFTHNMRPSQEDLCLNKTKHINTIQELAGAVYEVPPGLTLKEGYVVKVEMKMKSRPSLGGTVSEVIQTAGGQPLSVPVGPVHNISEKQCKDWANIMLAASATGDNPIPALPPITWGTEPAKFKEVVTRVNVQPAIPYTENRVRVMAFGTMPPNSPLLAKSKYGGDKAHALLIKRFDLMADAFKAATNLPVFKISDGIRKFGRSDSTVSTDIGVEGQTVFRNVSWQNKEEYEQQMIRIYGSVRVGASRIAYMSPHMTGLAIDLSWTDPARGRLPGLTSQTGRWSVRQQKTSRAFAWLKDHAHKYGFSPYKEEPWHWECLIPRENWSNGQEFIASPPFTGVMGVRIVETSRESGLATTNARFSRSKFA